jgi:hypothetical protein
MRLRGSEKVPWDVAGNATCITLLNGKTAKMDTKETPGEYALSTMSISQHLPHFAGLSILLHLAQHLRKMCSALACFTFQAFFPCQLYRPLLALKAAQRLTRAAFRYTEKCH